jgi:hypothetical protein
MYSSVFWDVTPYCDLFHATFLLGLLFDPECGGHMLAFTGLHVINVTVNHTVALRRSDFAFCFDAVYMQLRFSLLIRTLVMADHNTIAF